MAAGLLDAPPVDVAEGETEAVCSAECVDVAVVDSELDARGERGADRDVDSVGCGVEELESVVQDEGEQHCVAAAEDVPCDWVAEAERHLDALEEALARIGVADTIMDTDCCAVDETLEVAHCDADVEALVTAVAEDDCVLSEEPLELREGDTVELGENDPREDCDDDAVPVRDPLTLLVAEGVADSDELWSGVLLDEGDGESERLGRGVREGDEQEEVEEVARGDADAESVTLDVGVAHADALSDRDSVVKSEPEGTAESEKGALADTSTEGVADSLVSTLMLPVVVRVGKPELVALALGDGEALPQAVARGDGERVAAAVAEDDPKSELLPVAHELKDNDADELAQPVPVCEMLDVAVGDAENDADSEPLGVAEDDAVVV